ncbi:MAG: protein-arginine deiminase family protein [Polyangiaceae bacterium]
MMRAARLTEAAHGPDGQGARTITASPNVLIGRRTGQLVAAVPGPAFHIHVDADRDGQPDPDWRNADRWDFQRTGLGAIVLPNLDPSRPRRAEDIAPLVIRRDPATAGRSAAGWRGELFADNPYKLTLLSGRSASATPLTDPLRAPLIDLDLSQDEIELGMEATQHPGPYLGKGRDPDPLAKNPAWVFEGLVRIHLRIFDPSGAMIQNETALVRVAPWIAFSHFDPTERVYISTLPEGQDIRDKIGSLSPAVPLQQIAGDRWTQDQGEPGFTSAPETASAALQRPALLELKMRLLGDALQNDMAVVRTLEDEAEAIDEKEWAGQSSGGVIDFGGDIETVPPFVHPSNGRVYAFGRLFHGTAYPSATDPTGHRPFYGPLRRFFDSQAIQEPFALDTGWLRVGHVDEVVCMLPMKDARLGFRVLIASHRLALDLVAPLDDATPIFGPHAQTRSRIVEEIETNYILHTTGRRWGKQYPAGPIDLNVGFLKNKSPYNVRRCDFAAITSEVTRKISAMRAILTREIGLQADDFIELPVLFMGTPPSVPPAQPTSLSAVAFTPGVVNGLVITRGDPTWSGARTVTYVAPKPFGPLTHARGRKPSPPNDCVFEEHIRNALGPPSRTGVEVVFADDFLGYHVEDGEVHCGTNSLRTPPTDRRWWAPRQDTRKKKRP